VLDSGIVHTVVALIDCPINPPATSDKSGDREILVEQFPVDTNASPNESPGTTLRVRRLE